MKTVVIVQARMGSTRLPGKVLLPIGDRPMLAHVMQRIERASSVDAVVVATTTKPADDVLAEACSSQGWLCFRGDEDDLLDRYYRAALAYDATVVVRVTSDCPLIDPGIIDAAITFFHRPPAVDYLCTSVPTRSFPRGLGVEVMTMAALATAWQRDKDPAFREHVTPYLYRNPDQFRLRCYSHGTDHSDHRWTVDTREDLALVRKIYAQFDHTNFDWLDVLGLFDEHPEWKQINQHIQQKVLL